MKSFLGIDMSCYTTSCAVTDENGNVIYDGRIPLSVPPGKKGLRQQEMVFLHIKQIKEIMPKGFEIVAVASSIKPRDAEGSYMPVFAACESYGRVIANALNAEFYPLTHQHGHIASATIGNDVPDRFIALHVSGGTTDIVLAEKEDGVITKIERLGESSDIAAGQFIDRIGTEIGVPFPCGPYMEELAKKGMPEKVSAKFYDMNVSFSGPESAVKRLIEKGLSKEDASATVQYTIRDVLNELIDRAIVKTGERNILLSGGVMSNAWISGEIAKRGNVWTAQRKYSSDNSCGLALLCRNIYYKNLNKADL